MGGERIIEMTWRCSGCQRQNLGRYKSCQGCGNPKDASEQFEMPSNTVLAPTVTDPNLLRMATAGPDWRCGSCGSDQRRSDDACANCGAAVGAAGPAGAAAPGRIRVPKYRDVPRSAEFFGYKARAWAHDRTEREHGVLAQLADELEAGGSRLKWPAGARTSGLPPGEQERDTRTARYFVTIRYGRGEQVRFEEKTEEAFARYRQGSTHTLSTDGGKYVLNGSPITPLNSR